MTGQEYLQSLDSNIANIEDEYVITQVFLPSLKGLSFQEIVQRDGELVSRSSKCRHSWLEREALKRELSRRIGA